MSIRIFPRFKSKSFEPDIPCDWGVRLLEFLEPLDAIASKRELKPLGDLNAYSEMEVPEDFDGNPDWLEDLKEQAEIQWHDPADAVATIDGLLEALRSRPQAKIKGKNREYIIEELEELKAWLSQAAKRRVKFHFDAN